MIYVHLRESANLYFRGVPPTKLLFIPRCFFSANHGYSNQRAVIVVNKRNVTSLKHELNYSKS